MLGALNIVTELVIMDFLCDSFLGEQLNLYFFFFLKYFILANLRNNFSFSFFFFSVRNSYFAPRMWRSFFLQHNWILLLMNKIVCCQLILNGFIHYSCHFVISIIVAAKNKSESPGSNIYYPFNVFVLSSFSIKRKHSWKTLISGLVKTPHTDSLGIEKPVSETFLNVKIALAEYRDFKIFI